MSNPYDPPVLRDNAMSTTGTDSAPTNDSIKSPWPTLVFLIAMMFVVGTAYFAYLAFQLRVAFPELHDPSPNADGYWPHLFHDIYLLLGGVLALAAFGLFVIAYVLRLRCQPRSNEVPLTEL